MCYETASTKFKPEIEEHYNIKFEVPLEYEPYYHRSAFGYPNLQIIKMDEPESVWPATWGFVPEFAMRNINAFRHKYTTFNARQETVLTSNIYKHSAREKRCLIIADGFFEPHYEGTMAQPYFCYIPSEKFPDGRDLFLFAGLYSEIDKEANAYSCTILTTAANFFFEEIHNKKKRMPLVLNESLANEWFMDRLNDNQLAELMHNGFTDKKFKAHQVSNDFYKRGIDTNKPYILEEVKPA